MDRKIVGLLLCLLIITVVAPQTALVQAEPAQVGLLVIEHRLGEHGRPQKIYATEDDSGTNPSYKLLGFKWYITANWINPSNKYGFSASAVVTAIVRTLSLHYLLAEITLLLLLVATLTGILLLRPAKARMLYKPLRILHIITGFSTLLFFLLTYFLAPKI